MSVHSTIVSQFVIITKYVLKNGISVMLLRIMKCAGCVARIVQVINTTQHATV